MARDKWRESCGDCNRGEEEARVGLRPCKGSEHQHLMILNTHNSQVKAGGTFLRLVPSGSDSWQGFSVLRLGTPRARAVAPPQTGSSLRAAVPLPS